MERVRVKPPVERPPMTKGTLLRSSKKRAHVFAKPKLRPDKKEAMGLLKKDEDVMSLGEFASSGKVTYIHVLTSLGPGWVRVGDIKAAPVTEDKKTP